MPYTYTCFSALFPHSLASTRTYPAAPGCVSNWSVIWTMSFAVMWCWMVTIKWHGWVWRGEKWREWRETRRIWLVVGILCSSEVMCWVKSLLTIGLHLGYAFGKAQIPSISVLGDCYYGFLRLITVNTVSRDCCRVFCCTSFDFDVSMSPAELFLKG